MLKRGFCQLSLLLCVAIIFALLLARWPAPHSELVPLHGMEIRPGAKHLPAGGTQFVDARSQADFARGHAPQAVRLNSAEWQALIPGFYDAWEPGQNVIVYGRARSDEAATVAHRLRAEAGLEKVFVFKGIWEEWPRN